MFAQKEILGFGPNRSENVQHLFSVGLPRMRCAYFVCVLSVLYAVSALIVNRESFSLSAITPVH